VRSVIVAPNSKNCSYVVEDRQVEHGLLWRLDPADTATWVEQLSQGETFAHYEPVVRTRHQGYGPADRASPPRCAHRSRSHSR
jgi:hypothetical protein